MTAEITQLLHAIGDGREADFEQLFDVVYKELRSRAASYLPRQEAGHTLQPTALVHEAYLRLSNQEELDFKDRAHFFAVSATAMRQILVDHARSKKRQKRGGNQARVPLEDSLAISETDEVDLVELDEALTRLAQENERGARVVELRFFAGMSVEEAAEVLEVGTATVKRDWSVARLWLFRELASKNESSPEADA